MEMTDVFPIACHLHNTWDRLQYQSLCQIHIYRKMQSIRDMKIFMWASMTVR